MRDGWDVKPLKEVCLIKPPKSEARKGQNADFLVSFAPMETLGIDQKYLITNQTRTMSDVVGSYTYFSNGDVLLAKITPCFENGKLGIASDLINNIGFGSSEYIVFRANEQLDAEWLYYYLSRQSFRNEGASRMAGAVGHKRITKDFIEDYPIPIPPLPEQRRIVAILDKAFEGIATAKANIEKNLQNAREIFESHLNAVFSQRGEGWVEKRLDEVGKTQTGSTPKASEPENLGKHIPFVKPGDFKPDGSITYDNEGLSQNGAAKARLVMAPSAIMVCIGATIGKSAYANRIIATNQQINSLTPATGISAKMVYYQMITVDFQRRVHENAGQATLPIINKSKWSSLSIFIPPTVDEQNHIVARLDNLHEETQRLESLYQKKLIALDELKQSLLHQAFNGDL